MIYSSYDLQLSLQLAYSFLALLTFFDSWQQRFFPYAVNLLKLAVPADSVLFCLSNPLPLQL